MYVQLNIVASSGNHCCSEKAICIKYSKREREEREWERETGREREGGEILCVCVCVASIIQYAKRMRRIILSSVACLAISYFS